MPWIAPTSCARIASRDGRSASALSPAGASICPSTYPAFTASAWLVRANACTALATATGSSLEKITPVGPLRCVPRPCSSDDAIASRASRFLTILYSADTARSCLRRSPSCCTVRPRYSVSTTVFTPSNRDFRSSTAATFSCVGTARSLPYTAFLKRFAIASASSGTPGPIVVETVRERRYVPFDAAGLARTIASMRAMPLAASCSAPNECLPIGVWMLPALSTRNSTLPAFASRAARGTSNVTVPSFGFGMRPRGPSTFPSRPTCPMRSGVAIAVSNSIQPPCTRSTRSSAPITSAPDSRASRSFSPLANTATRTFLPMPCGSTTAPRTIWSACLGSTPRRNERSTDWSNFADGMLFRSATASSRAYCLSGAIFAAASLYRLPVRLLTTVAHPLSPTCPVGSLHDVDAHAAGRAFDGAHRRIDRVGVQVHQLGLRDLPDLLSRDLADLVLVGHRRRLGDSRRALE